MPRTRLACVVLLIVTAAGPLRACPVCASPTGEAVRAGLADDLPRSAAAVGVPALVLTAALVALHGPRRGGDRR